MVVVSPFWCCCHLRPYEGITSSSGCKQPKNHPHVRCTVHCLQNTDFIAPSLTHLRISFWIGYTQYKRCRVESLSQQMLLLVAADFIVILSLFVKWTARGEIVVHNSFIAWINSIKRFVVYSGCTSSSSPSSSSVARSLTVYCTLRTVHQTVDAYFHESASDKVYFFEDEGFRYSLRLFV